MLDNGLVLRLEIETGRSVWERRLGAAATTGVPYDDRLFVGSADNFFYSLSSEDGDVKWRWRTGADIIGTAALDATRVYFVSLDNVLRSLD